MDYTLKRVRRSRSVRIRVEPTGEVVVTAPVLAPRFMIEKFVAQNAAWIERQQHRTVLKRDVYPTLDWEKKIVSYLGKLYRVNIHPRGVQQRIEITHQEITLFPITGLERDARKMLASWLKRQGETHIRERLPILADRMKLRYGTVTFRQQKSRWGSCSGRGNLSFNWRLIHFNSAIIDYVIIHELAHIKHHDHSARFWELVRQHDATYDQKRKFLRHQVVRLEKG